MFGILQSSGHARQPNSVLNQPQMPQSQRHRTSSAAQDLTEHTGQSSKHNKGRKASSSSSSSSLPPPFRQLSPMNLPQYPPTTMSRPIRDERQFASIPTASSMQLPPNLGLSCLADAALADATTKPITPLNSPPRKSSITLPPISSLISPVTPAANEGYPTPFIPPSGSSAVAISATTHTPPRSRSPKSGLKSDQPVMSVNGWLTSSEKASNAHMPVVTTPFPPRRPSRKERQKKTVSRSRPDSSDVQLEYNVRSYTRVAAANAAQTNQTTVPTPCSSHSQNRPTRSTRMKLPHPLQGLTLDKTYPERRVEDWHNDAQKLLRPPATQSITNTESLHQTQLSNPPPPHTLIPTIRKIHPPINSWDQYAYPQIQNEQYHLPQIQPTTTDSPPHVRRHQSSSSLTGMNWNTVFDNNPPQMRSYTFIPENPELLARSRNGNIINNSKPAPQAMHRSQSAHSSTLHPKKTYSRTISEPSSPKPKRNIGEEMKIGGSLPTPVTGTLNNHWQPEEDVNPTNKGPTGGTAASPVYQAEVLSLPQVQQSTPPFPPSSIASQFDSTMCEQTLHPSRLPGLALTRDITPIHQEMEGSSSFQQPSLIYDESNTTASSHVLEEPSLLAEESTDSESNPEPASADDDDEDRDEGERGGDSGKMRLRIRIPKNSNRKHSQPISSAISSKTSLRARSSSQSQSSENSDLIKYEPSSSPTASYFSPSTEVDPKRQRTRNKNKSTSDNGQSSENGNSSRNDNSNDGSQNDNPGRTGRGQRRNGERRREQNAVAQKKFRWKKKQMAAKMEADLESATALATSLKKEVAEKNQLVNKLKGEVGSLKRKLKTLES